MSTAPTPAIRPTAGLDDGAATPRKLRREVGGVALMCFSAGGIVGAGWLFAALFASQIAGPAALVSWLIGGAAVMLLALIYAELGGMYPVAAGTIRFPLYAFGGLLGFAGGWFAFLATVTAAPLEVEAALIYANNYAHTFCLDQACTKGLTPTGYLLAAVAMLVFAAINVMGVKWLSQTNKWIVFLKLAIPALAVIALLATSFHPGNFSTSGGFMPFGWKGVLSALTGGGVIFSYLGFQTAVNFGAESRNPRRDIPFAVIGSMVIAFVLYVGLQVAFTAALSPASLAKGWRLIAFTGSGGPFAGLATALGLGWLAFLLYADSVISPGAVALIALGGNPRLTFALARSRYLPRFLGSLSGRGVPLNAIILAFVCGLLVFLPFPGWQRLAQFLLAAGVMTYALAPLALGALRLQEPDRTRPYRLPGAIALAPIGFIVANEIILITGWAIVWKLMVAILIGFALLAISAIASGPKRRRSLDWISAIWLWPYLIGITVLSYWSSFNVAKPESLPMVAIKGPIGVLPFGWDLVAMAVFSLAIYVLAVRMRLSAARVQELVGETASEAEPIPTRP